jgi:hypothetical protein
LRWHEAIHHDQRFDLLLPASVHSRSFRHPVVL